MENYDMTHTDDLPSPETNEDQITKSVEDYTASLPSSAYLGVALGAMGLSLALQLKGDGKWGNFIGQWVPTWLLIGVYNKLVKLEGHDKSDAGKVEELGQFTCDFCDSAFSLKSDLENHRSHCGAAVRVS
ncbi:MAG TPA: hypothetical protein VHM64_18375 [Candidatus Binatia bacterium]|nr:hypothetical protein [Candidatus Binatia bacterium]